MPYVGRLKGSMYLVNARLAVTKYLANTRLDLRNATNSLQIDGKGVLPGDPYHWRGRNTEHGTRDTYTHAHTYIHTYMHTYIRTYLHTYLPTYVRTYVRTYVPTYLRTYVHTDRHTYIQHVFLHIPSYVFIIRFLPEKGTIQVG